MSIVAVAPATEFRRRAIFADLACLGLIWLADFLFYGRPLGWSVGLYGTAVLVAVLLRRSRRSWASMVLAAAIFGLAGACVVQPGPLAITLGLLGLVVLALTSRGGWTWSAMEWLRRLCVFLCRMWVQLPVDAAIRTRASGARGGAVGWLLPVGLSLVFVALFWVANPIIESWVTRFGDQFRNVGPGRVLLWVVVGFATYGLLRARVRRRTGSGHECAAQPMRAPILAPTLLLRCLIVFNVIFAVQTGLDAAYLWGGAALPDGMTYAQYARRGAYPLMATALLAAAFVLTTLRAGDDDAALRWPRRLIYLWIAQNVFLTVSAGWRLWLYVEVFSLTRLRVAAGLWMVLVAFGLVGIVLRIVRRRSNDWLLGVNVVAAAVMLYGCCFLNVDGMIARFNVAHCREVTGLGVDLDVAYLEHLGPESLPSLHWVRENGAPKTDAARAAGHAADRLSVALQHDLADWRGWTWRRAQLASAGDSAAP